MMHNDVPALITQRPAQNMFDPVITPELFNAFLPADLIAHPIVYEAEFQDFFRQNPAVQTIWETGRSGDPDTLNTLNTAVIGIAIERLRQQNKKA